MLKKVVVIEDEEQLGRLIQAFLEKHDYKVSYVKDGESGLQVIRDAKPDLILTDLLLPGVHGFDICKAIKNDPQLMDIPLMVMSAVYKTAKDKHEAQRMGVDEFIEKPLNFHKLLLTINRLTGSEDHPEEGPTPDSKLETGRSLDHEILKLQKAYADQLPEKIESMEHLWGNIQKNDNNEKRLTKFRRLAHKLCGSGETFGFDEITKYARELEEMLDIIILEGEHSLEKRKEKIDGILDNMRLHPMVTTGKQLRKMKI